MRTPVFRFGTKFGLDRLSIRTRIFGGFAVVLFLLGVLAAISIRGTASVEAQSARVEESGRLATSVADFARQVDEARARVMQYALSETDGDLQLAHKSLEQLQAAAGSLRTLSAGGEARQIQIAQIGEHQAKYAAAADRMIQAIGERRSNTAVMNKAGTELRTIVSAISAALIRDKAAGDLLEKGVRLNDAFQSGNAAAIRFLASRNPADAAAARAELDGMRQALEAVKAGTADNRRVQRFTQAIVEPAGQFEKALAGL